jgi:predicted Ser/Thr protein kinase
MLGRTYGRYRTVAPIGEGGMATVWRAVDPLLERDVALKLLSPPLARSPEARRRFRREADVAQLLDHPAIAPVFDSGESDTDAWLAMALVDGETLAQRMGRGLVPVNECVDIAAILASALGYAHARGVLHRDLSTRNVMLARDGRVFLLDFGLAKLEGASSLTRSASVPGTLLYMAPEVLCGGAADPRSDLYSLSAVLYELVTGTPPHPDDAPESLIYAKLNTTPRPANELRPDAPPALVRLLARTLDRDPAARPADAEEFLGDLRGPHGPEPTEPSGARSAGELLAEGQSVIYLGVPPFEVQVADQVQLAELATSLADALRRRLGSLRRLHVLQVRAPLEPDGDVLKWATLHGANLVIVGRLGRRGAHARVECTLLDPVGRVSLAGETVEGSWFDAFALEDRLVACCSRFCTAISLNRTPSPRPLQRTTTGSPKRDTTCSATTTNPPWMPPWACSSAWPRSGPNVPSSTRHLPTPTSRSTRSRANACGRSAPHPRCIEPGSSSPDRQKCNSRLPT